MQKRRKRLILIATLTTFALVCIVGFLFHPRTSETFSFTSAEKNPPFGVGEMNWEPLSSLPPQKPVQVAQPIPTSTAIVSGTQFAPPQPASPVGRQLLFRRNFPLLTMQIGVVDVDRVLTLYSVSDESHEARAKAINEIELAIATRAEAHNCIIVLNESGETMNKIPVVLYSADTLDLTDEVIAQLGY